MKYIFLSLMLSKPSVDKCSAARPTSILLHPQREGQEKHFIRTSIFLTTSGQKLGETSTGKKKRVWCYTHTSEPRMNPFFSLHRLMGGDKCRGDTEEPARNSICHSLCFRARTRLLLTHPRTKKEISWKGDTFLSRLIPTRRTILETSFSPRYISFVTCLAPLFVPILRSWRMSVWCITKGSLSDSRVRYQSLCRPTRPHARVCTQKYKDKKKLLQSCCTLQFLFSSPM